MVTLTKTYKPVMFQQPIADNSDEGMRLHKSCFLLLLSINNDKLQRGAYDQDDTVQACSNLTMAIINLSSLDNVS